MEDQFGHAYCIHSWLGTQSIFVTIKIWHVAVCGAPEPGTPMGDQFSHATFGVGHGSIVALREQEDTGRKGGGVEPGVK
jgi:hypothetical protein